MIHACLQTWEHFLHNYLICIRSIGFVLEVKGWLNIYYFLCIIGFRAEHTANFIYIAYITHIWGRLPADGITSDCTKKVVFLVHQSPYKGTPKNLCSFHCSRLNVPPMWIAPFLLWELQNDYLIWKMYMIPGVSKRYSIYGTREMLKLS